MQRYKIQPGTNSPLKKKRFIELLQLVSINQLIVGGVSQYIFSLLHISLHGTTSSDIERLPSLPGVLFDIVVFTIIEEVLFFYCHWALHRYFQKMIVVNISI